MKMKLVLAAVTLSLIGTGALAAQAPRAPHALPPVGNPHPGAGPPAGATPQQIVEHGSKAFQYYCAPCHGAGKGSGNRPYLPGTDGLAIKYKGERPALLEERTDLTPDLVRFFVRNGVEGMPSFRKVELNDANLDAIGAYLARNNR